MASERKRQYSSLPPNKKRKIEEEKSLNKDDILQKFEAWFYERHGEIKILHLYMGVVCSRREKLIKGERVIVCVIDSKDDIENEEYECDGEFMTVVYKLWGETSVSEEKKEDGDNSEKVKEITKYLRDKSKSMFKEHSNLEMIRPSLFRLKKKKAIPEPCIAIYCSYKGVVPVGEKQFLSKMGGFATDIREGFFHLHSNYDICANSTDQLDPLRMGASISMQGKLEEMETENKNKVPIAISEAIPPERFMEYMKKAKTTVRHARGIVVGCSGAGKTTLLYRLMEKSLDEIKKIQSTRGLLVYEHIFLVKNGSLFATENDPLKKRLIKIPKSAFDESTNEKVERNSGNSADMRAGKELKAKQNTALSPKKNEAMDQQLAHDVIREIDAKERKKNVRQLAQEVMREVLDAKENEISISMIDFAGQFAYYACHQIYMRSEAFYILVLDMTKAFEDVVDGETDECQDAIFSKWLNKDYLHFWLDSIKSFGGTSAQVLVVATHTENKKDEEEQSFWESLWTLVHDEDKTWLQNCVGEKEFALGLIEMNTEGERSLRSLKNAIVEVVSQGLDTKIKVPSAWALFEHLLQETEKPILSIDDINEVNKKLPDEYQLRSQEEIFDFLSFFHGHGLLLFFKEDGLRTHAIFDIQWFSNAFSKLIAEKNHINRDCKRKYIKEWNCFNETGNLRNLLVDALWKEEPSYEEQKTEPPYEEQKTEPSYKEHKTELMSYMERLRMLVNLGETDGEISWYVPCMNKKCFTHDIFKQKREKSSILCFRFKSFAMFVYYRLIAHCMSFLKWSVPSDGKGSQCLYHTSAIFETEQNHTVIVGIYDNDIQVQVLRIANLQPKVSCEIGISIEIALTELTKTFDEKKTFQKGYKCLNIFCSEKDLTFIPENKLSGIQCNCPIEEKHEIDVQWTLGFWKEGMQTCVLGKRKECSRRHEKSKTNKIRKTEPEYPFSKGVLPTDVMTSYLKVEVSKSVGLILIDGTSEGTGFRIGGKYIMTCLHVIKDKDQNIIECDRICIQFGKTKVTQIDEPKMKFGFKSTVPYMDEEFDVAILELKTHQDSDVTFPPPLTSFGKMQYPSEIHIIGHPGCVQMKEDSQVYPNIIKPNNAVDEYLIWLSEWSREKLPLGIDYYATLRDPPQKVLFSTTFVPGSSGSPGFMIKQQKAYVVLIVRGGVPRCYYEDGVHVPANKRVEYGYAIEDINAKMQESSSELIKALASEIFGKCFETG